MQIPSTNNLFQSLLNPRQVAGERINWQPGQVVQARVVSDVVDGLVQLRIGATLLTAQIDTEVRIGQKLTLEVIRSGEQPFLQPISQVRLQQLIESAIRSVLPKQQSQAQLLSDLVELVTQKQLATLPEKVQIAIKQLYQSIVDVSSLRSADAVRNAISNSGIFLEAKLTQNNNTVNSFNSDFKVNLLRLQQVLQQHAALPDSAAKPTPETATTYTQANSQTLQSPFNRSGFIFLRQHYSQAPTGTFLRPDAQLISNTTASSGATQSTATQSAVNQLATNTVTGTTGNSSLPINPTTSSLPGIGLPGNTATPKPVVLVNGVPVNPGTNQTIPAHISLQHFTPGQLPGMETRSTPFYPTAMPFKVDMNIESVRPSARFSKLDSLTKILSFFLKDVDASLSRIQLTQLTQQPIEPEQKPSWVFEIPIKNNNNLDLFQFKIEKEQHSHSEQENEKIGWTIQIAFNIEELGQVYSTISIHQKKTSITFWSEQIQTVATFNQHIQYLQTELEGSGLIVDQLNCIRGSPPANFNQSINKNILDEKA